MTATHPAAAGTTPSPTKTVAAIDLGSNSFHLILAQVSDNHCRILHREKRKVRLAAGLDTGNQLSKAAIARAAETLAAFGEIIEHSQTDLVRTVGTYTFRTATNIDKLLRKVQKVYPHPIEILSGAEEARLIYQGVFRDMHLDCRSLIIDIGGGSTELVIGESREPLLVHSCPMGCVSLTERFFRDGAITDANFQEALIAAEQQLEPLLNRYLKLGWAQVIGTSGSVKMLSQCALALGLSDGTLRADTLQQIQQQLVAGGRIDSINLPGLQPDQGPVVCGGLAILIAAFAMLDIDQLNYCDAALREGLLADMQARMDNRDVRMDTVTALASRFASDPDYTRSVLDTGARLLQATGSTWSLDHSDHQQLLLWAAELHEIGLMINYDNAHQHAAYIVRNTIMPGFTHGQQAALAYLLLSHREKVFSGRKIPHLIPCSREILLRLSVLLRLAIMLNRCRLPTQFALQLQASELGLKVCFSSAWKPLQCLLEADLQQEQQYWNSVKLRLEWSFA